MIHYYFLSLSLASPSSRSFLDSKAHAFFCKLDKAFFNRLAHFMIRNSPVYGSLFQPCAQVCNHCAEVCDEIGENDCANACRASAASCEQMAKLLP